MRPRKSPSHAKPQHLTPRGRGVVLGVVTAALLVAGVTLPNAAGATSSWGTPVFVSDQAASVDADTLAVAADGVGAIAAWRDITASPNTLKVVFRTASGWGTPTTIATALAITDPVAAISADGTKALLIWKQGDYAQYNSTMASYYDGASWSTPTSLSGTYGQGSGQVYGLRLTMSTDGSKAIAAWYQYNYQGNGVDFANYAMWSNNTWSTMQPIATDGQQSTDPDVAMSADGTHAVAVWSEVVSNLTVVMGRSWTSGTWGLASQVSSTTSHANASDFYPRVAISGDGTTAIAAWEPDAPTMPATSCADPTKCKWYVEGAQNIGGTWGSPTTIDGPTLTPPGPTVSLSANGSIGLLAWMTDAGSPPAMGTTVAPVAVRARLWHGNGTLDAISNLSAAGQIAGAINAALSADGSRATAVWLDWNLPTAYPVAVEAATMQSGAWTRQGVISATNSTPRYTNSALVGISSDGTKSVADWVQSVNGSNQPLQSSTASASSPSPTPTITPTTSPTPTIAPPARSVVRGWPSGTVTARSGGALRHRVFVVGVTPANGRKGTVQRQSCHVVKKKTVCVWQQYLSLTWPKKTTGTVAITLTAKVKQSVRYRLVIPATAKATSYTGGIVTVKGA